MAKVIVYDRMREATQIVLFSSYLWQSRTGENGSSFLDEELILTPTQGSWKQSNETLIFTLSIRHILSVDAHGCGI